MPDAHGPFVVRYAENWDFALNRAWLPESLFGTPGAVIGVAVEVETGAVAGMAYFRVFCDRCVRFRIFVAPAFRRRGCGSRLFQWIKSEAVKANGTGLLTASSHNPAPEGEEAAGELAFFQAQGLSVTQDLIRYKSVVPQAIALLEPLYRRATREARTEHDARILSADQVDPLALSDFAVRLLGGFPEEVSARLRGTGRFYSLELSTAALVGGRVVGALLIVPEADNGFIETRAVDPAYRGGWINLGMMYCSAAAGARLGFTTLDFEGEAKDRDTTRLAQRLQATPVARRQCWGCSLPQDAEPSPALPDLSATAPLSGWHAEAFRDPRIHGADLPQLKERLFLDALCDVFHVMTERGVANVSATNPALGVNLRLNLERFGTEGFNRSSGLKNCLLFMALPQSDSLYVFETLAAGLGLDRVAIGPHAFPNATFNPNLVARLASPGTMCYSHADARLGNLALIHRLIDRLVVHVRDPRQSMLSAVHHLNAVRDTLGPNHVAGLGFSLPGDYFALSLGEQIDWMIANGLPEFVRWIEGWVDAAANPLFEPRILFMRHDDLHADPETYFATLLSYYGITWRAKEFRPSPAQTGKDFRRAEIDEWRNVLSHAQQETACALVPARVCARFGWPAR